MPDDIATEATTAAATIAVAPEHHQRNEVLAFAIGVAGWLVPGLGHALQKMWGRALAVSISYIQALAVT